VARVGDKRGKYRVLMGRPQERRPLGTPRWEDVIKMDLQEMEWGGEDLIDVDQDRVEVAGACECCDEPSDSRKFGEVLD